MLDAIGSVTGGIIFAVLLVHLLDNFQVLDLIVFNHIACLSPWIFRFPVQSRSTMDTLLAAASCFSAFPLCQVCKTSWRNCVTK